MSFSANLRDVVREIDFETEADRRHAVMLALEYSDLSLRSLGGEDVTAELKHLRAQADALVAKNGVIVGTRIRTEIFNALTKTIVAIVV